MTGRTRMSGRMRGRLYIGIPIMAVFAILSVVYAGMQVNAYYDARSSLEHAVLREEGKAPASMFAPSVKDLEAELEEIPGRLALGLFMAVFFGGLAVLGVRKLKAAQ